MGRSLGVYLLLLVACDRGDKPQQSTNATIVSAAAVAASAPSVAAPVASAPSAQPAPSAPPAAPTPGTLRLAIVSDAELMKSEQNQATILKKFLEKAAKTVDAAPVGDDERGYVKRLAENPSAPPALPASFASFETVVLLRVEPQRSAGGTKVSGGRTHLAVLHPPATEPAFSVVYTDRIKDIGSASLEAAQVGNWLTAHLKLREKGKTP